MELPLTTTLAPLLEDKASLNPKSSEENFVQVLERTGTNAKYRCLTCMHTFSGGNQKIRVHITGVKEGGSSVKACPNPDPKAYAFCTAPRVSHKRKIGSEERAQAKKVAKLVEAEKQMLTYKEAWNLLHAPGKLRDLNFTITGPSSEPKDFSLLHTSLVLAQNTPSLDATGSSSTTAHASTSAAHLQALLDEYGVERAEDFAHLEQSHLIRIADFLKVVPRKLFLDMLGVPPQQANQWH